MFQSRLRGAKVSPRGHEARLGPAKSSIMPPGCGITPQVVYNETMPEPANARMWGEQAQDLLLKGDLAGAVPLLVRSAEALLDEGKEGEAAITLISAARLHAIRGQAAEAAEVLKRAQGPAQRSGHLPEWLRAQAELAEVHGDGEAAQRGWQQAAGGGDTRAREFALGRLAELAVAQGQPLRAADCYGELLAAAEGRQERARCAELLVERAICRNAGGEVDGALQDLLRAEPLLGPGDGGLRARLLGQRGLMAALRGDFDAALALGEQARDAAVSRSDVLAYLPTVALIASIHQRRGREVEAYDTLVRARVSLKDLIGRTGEVLVQPLLDSFAQAVGPRLPEIEARWAEMRQAARR